VHDTATITPPTGVTTAITGTVTYTLFSFAALPSATAPCSGGTVVGVPQTVTIGAGNAVPDATPVTLASAGFYGYSASYGGDANYVATNSNCEPLTVNKASPTLATTLSATSVVLGSSVTDSAMLSNSFQACGSVTYTLYTGG